MISFTGVDIVVSRSIPSDRLRACVSEVLAMPQADVAVISDVANYPQEAGVVCVVSRTSGEYVELVSIQCDERTLPLNEPVEVAVELARVMKVSLITPVNDDNPYAYWQVDADGRRRAATVDPRGLDDGEYIVRS